MTTSDDTEAVIELLEDALSKATKTAGLQPKQRRSLMRSMVPHFIEASTLLAPPQTAPKLPTDGNFEAEDEDTGGATDTGDTDTGEPHDTETRSKPRNRRGRRGAKANTIREVHEARDAETGEVVRYSMDEDEGADTDVALLEKLEQHEREETSP